MILVTSFFTGLFAAMLRSVFAVIVVAFLVAVAFIAAYALTGASILSLLIAIGGFNLGLAALAAAHVLAGRMRSA